MPRSPAALRQNTNKHYLQPLGIALSPSHIRRKDTESRMLHYRRKYYSRIQLWQHCSPEKTPARHQFFSCPALLIGIFNNCAALSHNYLKFAIKYLFLYEEAFPGFVE